MARTGGQRQCDRQRRGPAQTRIQTRIHVSLLNDLGVIKPGVDHVPIGALAILNLARVDTGALVQFANPHIALTSLWGAACRNRLLAGTFLR